MILLHCEEESERAEARRRKKKVPCCVARGRRKGGGSALRNRELSYGKIYNVLNKSFSLSAKIPPANFIFLQKGCAPRRSRGAHPFIKYFCFLFLRKDDLAVLLVDDDRRIGADVALQNFFGEAIFHKFLDGTFQRPCAEFLAVPLVHEFAPRAGTHLQGHAPLFQPRFERGENFIADLRGVRLGELVEDDDIVQPVQKFGAELLF